jgi:glycosyltransferase involved in cell wall biosynthesis
VGSPAATRGFLGYTDYIYRQRGGRVYADRAFALFLARVGEEFRSTVLVGRVVSDQEGARYELPEDVRLVAMPWYTSLADPIAVGRAMFSAIRVFGRALDGVDVVWLLGPHPIEVPLALLARARGRRVVLGVRQDLPAYVRSRHPDRRLVHLLGYALEGIWRALALRLPVVVVGEDLARRYRHAPRVLPITVSLIREEDIMTAEDPDDRAYDGELRILSVGRLEEEKNPLLLADILARLEAAGRRCRLLVCGEGPLEGALRDRLAELGLEDRAELLGYVPLDGGLLDLYRTSHAFLHVSFTEGAPQVLQEAFASRLPVVATAVGGVADAVGDAGLLIGPDDADAAVEALGRVVDDPSLRERLVNAGTRRARSRTIDAEARRVAAFMTAE